MQSPRTQAFVNMYAAMGTLDKYVELDPKAKEIASTMNLTIRFKVKDGPDAVLDFKDGAVSIAPYDGQKTNVLLFCTGPEQFNKVVDGKAMPIPLKGLVNVLKFMAKPDQPFNVLTTNMADTMRKTEFATKEEKALTTRLAFYAMTAALAQIANEDELGRISAGNMADGEISVGIKDDTYVTLAVKDHKITYIKKKAENARAFMEFADIDTTKGLIDGNLDAMSCICNGGLELKGFVPMLEQLNKVLNLVPKYLA